LQIEYQVYRWLCLVNLRGILMSDIERAHGGPGAAAAQQGRIQPGDRFISRSDGRKKLNMSAMTEWRRLRDDPDFPQPIDNKYVVRELEMYMAVLAARPATARPGPRRAASAA
jgi:hypothetical protein